MARAASPRIGVVSHPGSSAEVALRALRVCGLAPVALEYAAEALAEVDAVLVTGEVAATTPLLRDLITRAGRGLPVLGVGDGFRALCEADLLPGEVVANASGRFTGTDQKLRVETHDTIWTSTCQPGELMTLPVRTGVGNFRADPETLRRLESDNQVVFRFVDRNPTGSANDIAGITNAAGNIVGLVAHPEYAVEEILAPGTDGRRLWAGLQAFLALIG